MDEHLRGPTGYEFFDHTADLGLALYAEDFEGLLEVAARALFDILTDRTKVRETDEVRVALSARNGCELLVSWLQELIYLHETGEWLFSSFCFETASQTSLSAVARGERFDAKRHEIRGQVKAATYHDLLVTRTQKGVEARIILDT